MVGSVMINISMPKQFAEYIDRQAEERFLPRAAVARQLLAEHIIECMVVEARKKGYSIRRVGEVTRVPYRKVLEVLARTRVDDEVYPYSEEEEQEELKTLEELRKKR